MHVRAKRLLTCLGLALLLAPTASPSVAEAGPRALSASASVVITPFETRGEARDVGLQDADLISVRDAWLAQNPTRDARLTVRATGLETHADLEVDRRFALAIKQAWPKGLEIRVVGEGHHLTLDAGGFTLDRTRMFVDGGDFIVVGGGMTLARSSLKVSRGGAYLGGAGTMVLRASELQVNHGLHIGSRRVQAQGSKLLVKGGNFTMQDGARVLLSSAVISTRTGFSAAPRSALIFSGRSRITSTSGEMGFPTVGELLCGSEAAARGTSCSYQDEREVLVLNASDGSTRRMRRRSDILTAEWDELIALP